MLSGLRVTSRITWFWAAAGVVLAAGACSGKSDVEDPQGNGASGSGTGGSAASGSGASGNGASEGDGGSLNLGGEGHGASDGFGGEGPACESAESSAQLSPIYLAFAFDVSGSMGHLDCPYWNHDPAVKWTPVVDATTEFFSDPSSTNIHASMTLFPSANNSTKCQSEDYETPDVAMQALPSTAFAEALAAYEEEVGLSDYADPVPVGGGGPWRGGTPTLAVVDGTLEVLRPLASEHADAKFALVLVTDGVPLGCTDNSMESVVSSVTGALADDGIPTYVIGVKDPAAPGMDAVAPWEQASTRVWACQNDGGGWRAGYSEVDTPRPTDVAALDNLSQIAVAGGTEEAFLIDTGNPSATRTAFRTAIDRIRAQAVSCELDRPPPPAGQTFDPDRVNVRYDSGDERVPLVFDPDCEDDNSWRYRDGGTSVIELCPSTCEQIQEDPYAAVQVEFGCQRRTVVR